MTTNIKNSAVMAKKSKMQVPLDVFPQDLEEAITEMCKSNKLPKDFYLLGLLSAYSVAIGNRVKVARKNGNYKQVCSIYGCMVGVSASGKTPVLNWCMKPLYKKEEDFETTYKNNKNTYYEKPVKERDEENFPIRDNILTGDATIEAISKMLYDEGSRGLILHKDELIGWAKGMNAYRSGKGEDLEKFLSMFNGGSLKVNRKLESSFVKSTFLSIIGGTQPKILNELTNKRNLSNGLIQRILFAYPETSVPDLEYDEPTFDKYDEIHKNHFGRLYDYEFSDENKILNLSKEADALWVTYVNNGLRQEARKHLETPYHSAVMKLEQYCMRFALILELLHSGSSIPENISENSMEQAMKLTNYFWSMAKKVYDVLEDPLSNLKQNEKAFYISIPDAPFLKPEYALVAESKFSMKRTKYYDFLKKQTGKDKLFEIVDVECQQKDKYGNPILGKYGNPLFSKKKGLEKIYKNI